MIVYSTRFPLDRKQTHPHKDMKTQTQNKEGVRVCVWGKERNKHNNNTGTHRETPTMRDGGATAALSRLSAETS